MPGGTNKPPLSVLTFSTKIIVINKEKEAKRNFNNNNNNLIMCCYKPKGGTKQSHAIQDKQMYAIIGMLFKTTTFSTLSLRGTKQPHAIQSDPGSL
jgi:hypothetical protein